MKISNSYSLDTGISGNLLTGGHHRPRRSRHCLLLARIRQRVQRAMRSAGIRIDAQLYRRRPFATDGGITLGQGGRVEPLSPV